MSRGHILVFFNRHCSTMNLVKEKQGGLVSLGHKRWPFKLIKHFADTTLVSPSPAGPAGCCPLIFLNLMNLKFRVRAPNGYSSLGRTKVLYATSLILLGARATLLRRKPSVLDMLTPIHNISNGDTKVFCRLNIVQSLIV